MGKKAFHDSGKVHGPDVALAWIVILVDIGATNTELLGLGINSAQKKVSVEKAELIIG
jgi:ABC-type spermidine/putrescine transport system permease subunit I